MWTGTWNKVTNRFDLSNFYCDTDDYGNDLFDTNGSIGSLGWELNEAGVQNVTVKRVTFTGTQNGVRIKSWGRASNGFVRNIFFQDATMVNVQNPIVIDQNYCPNNKNCPGQVGFLFNILLGRLVYTSITFT